MYVHLQEGASLSREEILEYLQKEIGERSAVPKDVTILKDMPMTPVGKIFKPALQWDAIRRTYQEELRALGDMAVSLTVTVKEDKLHGTLVTLAVKPAPQVSAREIETRVHEILSRYTVKYRIEIT